MPSKKNKKKFKKEAGKEKNLPTLSERTKAWISGILMFLVGLIVFLSFFDKAGAAGRLFFSGFEFLIGKSIFLLPVLFFLAGVSFLKKQQRRMSLAIWLGILILVLGVSGLLAILEAKEIVEGTFQITKEEGGIIGYLIALPLQKAFGFEVTLIINSAIIIIGGLILIQFLLPEKKKIVSEEEKPPSFIKKIISPKFKIREVPPAAEAPVAFPEEKRKIPGVSLRPQAQESFLAKELKVKPIEKKEEIQYQKPPLELLEADRGKPSSGDIRVNSAIIKKTLQNFAIPVEMSEVNVGPTVTQYTFKPAEGIKLSRITALSNDLALALAAHPIRIEAPIPGRPLVGIEVPNKIRAEVRLRNLISHPVFQNSPANLLLASGRDVAGNPIFADLDRMPHLLVAGSTGTGKTCAADTLIFTEKGLLTFDELHPLPLNSEADFKIKVVSRDGIETTEKIYNNGICQFYKLSTSRGYQIEVTSEHPLWVLNKAGGVGWKPTSLIEEGDYVAISRGPALFGNKVDLSDFKPSEIKTYHKKISFPQKMTPQLAQFLGLLTADGGISIEKKGIHRITYTQANPELLSLFKKSLKELFGITRFIEKVSGSNPNNKAKEIVVNSKHLKEFLSFLGMDSVKSPQKVIPRAIREAPKEEVRAYLRALFDNDGYIGKESIELSLSSEKLVSQVQIILLNFGIISSLRVKKIKKYAHNRYFRLSLYGEDCRKFIKEIGFVRKEKYQKAKKLLKLSSNPNVDLVPHVSSLLKILAHKYLNYFAHLTNEGWQYQSGILIPKYAFTSLKSYNSGERTPSYQALTRILNFYQPISKEPEYQKLNEISKRNFYWDKVEKINRTSGVGYDFFVPGSDSFVGNGFVNHNTIFLNSLILSLLHRNSPEILRFILIDPKRVEFPVYNQLPHLLTPVIFNVGQTVNALKWLIQEMERRFDVLSEAKTRDIAVYNNEMVEREGEIMPYIILIIDELADLMAARAREVEAGIVRIAQMARAVGIHLVLATQRPSVEVITGLIKANITSRITFQVASQVDSRTVLDMAGAEKLLGAGDMLYVSSDVAKPKRIQAAYVSEKEVKRVVNWIKKIEQPKEIMPEPLSQSLEKTLTESEEQIETFFEGDDPLFEEAKRVVIEAKKASASLLQRRLRIGYARAARLIDMLEEKGIVGPGEGAKPREVYIIEDEK